MDDERVVFPHKDAATVLHELADLFASGHAWGIVAAADAFRRIYDVPPGDYVLMLRKSDDPHTRHLAGWFPVKKAKEMIDPEGEQMWELPADWPHDSEPEKE